MMSADEADLQTDDGVRDGCLRASNPNNPRTPVGRPTGMNWSRTAATPPANAADLEMWLRALVRDADPHNLPAVLAEAETTASRRFPADQVVAALRRALGTPP